MIRFFRKVMVKFGPDEEREFLEPIHEESREWLAKQPMNKEFKANMKATRNPDHHRKAFAMFNLVLDNHPTHENVTDVLTEMKVRSGHYTEFIKAGDSKLAKHLIQLIEHYVGDEDDKERMRMMVKGLERQAKMVYMPKSIAFDNMGQEDFEELYDEWVPIACAMIGVSDVELRRELAKF